MIHLTIDTPHVWVVKPAIVISVRSNFCANFLWTLCLLQKSSNRYLEKESMTKSKKLWYTRYNVVTDRQICFPLRFPGSEIFFVSSITNTITYCKRKLEITRSMSLKKFLIFSHFERSINAGFTLCAVVVKTMDNWEEKLTAFIFHF